MLEIKIKAMKEITREEAIEEIKDRIFQYEQIIERDTELRKLNIELLKELEKEPEGLTFITNIAVLAALQSQLVMVASKPIMKKRHKSSVSSMTNYYRKSDIPTKNTEL